MLNQVLRDAGAQVIEVLRAVRRFTEQDELRGGGALAAGAQILAASR